MSARRPEDDDYGPPEYGVRSSDLGSFLPEGTYQPKPIVWFAGAWFLQTIPLAILFIVLINKHPIFTALAGGLITFWVANMTWRRGMGQTSRGWQMATGTALLFNWALVSFGAFVIYWEGIPR